VASKSPTTAAINEDFVAARVIETGAAKINQALLSGTGM